MLVVRRVCMPCLKPSFLVKLNYELHGAVIHLLFITWSYLKGKTNLYIRVPSNLVKPFISVVIGFFLLYISFFSRCYYLFLYEFCWVSSFRIMMIVGPILVWFRFLNLVRLLSKLNQRRGWLLSELSSLRLDWPSWKKWIWHYVSVHVCSYTVWFCWNFTWFVGLC